MNEQMFDPVETDQAPASQSRQIEPDWTESEWFQVWLQLARSPNSHKGDNQLSPEIFVNQR